MLNSKGEIIGIITCHFEDLTAPQGIFKDFYDKKNLNDIKIIEKKSLLIQKSARNYNIGLAYSHKAFTFISAYEKYDKKEM